MRISYNTSELKTLIARDIQQRTGIEICENDIELHVDKNVVDPRYSECIAEVTI